MKILPRQKIIYSLPISVFAVTPVRLPILPVMVLSTSVGASATTHIMFTFFALYGMPILPTMYSPNCDSRAFMFAACVLSSTIMLITATLDCIKNSPFLNGRGEKTKSPAAARRGIADNAYSPLRSQICALPTQAEMILTYGTKKSKHMNNSNPFSHTAGMKKLLLILLTAVIAAAGLGTAACSKGQTGGGNNALSGYTRSAGEENGDDGCKAGYCDCGDDCPCRRDGEHRPMPKDNMPPMPGDEDTSGGMNGFEFDRGRLGKKRQPGLPGFIMPNGNVSGRPPLPDGDIPTGDGADGAEGAKITDADDADGTEQPDKNKNGENKKAAPHGVRKNGRHRQNGGRKNASGKLPKMPAENNGI